MFFNRKFTHTRLLAKVGMLCAIYLTQTGFVLLSPHQATLPVSPAQPKITFLWDGSYPDMKGKDDFEGGAYAALDDQAFFQQLLNIAVAKWNEVRGSYLKLEVQLSTESISMDPEDKIFSLVVESSDNASAAAYASPQMNEEGTAIIDCDINIASRKTEAESLLFTLVHELGHCIGLGHAHSNYGAIMGYSRTERQANLGADDKAGIIFLYPDSTYGGGHAKELVSCGTVTTGMTGNSPTTKGAAGLQMPEATQTNLGYILLLFVLGVPAWLNGALGRSRTGTPLSLNSGFSSHHDFRRPTPARGLCAGLSLDRAALLQTSTNQRKKSSHAG